MNLPRVETFCDKQGTPIVLGATAVIIKGHLCKGMIGTVRDINKFPPHGKTLSARVADGPDDNPRFSAWCRPHDIVIVPAPANGGADGGTEGGK